MEFATLTAKPRTAHGKGPARRLRNEGRIPAVAYGPTLASTPVAVDPAALLKILQGPNGLNTVMRLQVEGSGTDDLLVMIRDFTHHPVTRQFVHADFLQVKLEEDIDVDVPFHTTGKPAGLVQGGVLHQIYRKLPIRTRPSTIPASITVDITPLELGHSLKAHELKLPEGVRVRLPAEQTLVSVVSPEKERPEDVAPGAPGAPAAAVPGAAPATAAPAKGAAPAAAGKAAPAKDEKKPAAKKK